MREGSLDAPTRHPLEWRDPGFFDAEALDRELRRVFDICHGCRRCFNLCDSFPRLFDLIDESKSGELNTVDSRDFGPIIDACTLCDMCFMTKCPYVPPHEFNLDFPHLMLRYKANTHRGGGRFIDSQLAKCDRNGRLARFVAPLANWASRRGNRLTRPLMERLTGIHRDAALPLFHRRTFAMRARKTAPTVDPAAPAFGRKVVLYSTCYVNYNNPGIGMALRAVLARNGVETETVYPACCGMPLLEQGDIAAVAARARKVAAAMKPWLDKGYAVVSAVPSCTLMLKFEWPLIEAGDANVRRLADNSFEASEYIVDIARKEGLAGGMKPLPGGVTVQLACHARAQNMGPKAADMLRLIPGMDVNVIERCSGHGGTWGMKKQFFETAIKVGKPVASQALKGAKAHLASECPLAGPHILQGMERLAAERGEPLKVTHADHPIELMARAYGIAP